MHLTKFHGGSEAIALFFVPVFENPAALSPREFIHGVEMELMGLSVAIALVGILVAYLAYVRRSLTPERAAAPPAPVRTILLNKYYVDELYDALFVNRTKDLGNALAAFDLGAVDGGVNGVGWLGRMSGELSRFWDQWVIDGLVNASAFGVKLISYPARVIQTGLVQTYAFFITLGVLVFLAYYLIRFRF